MLILEKLGQVPNDSDSRKAPQICLGLVVICGYPCLRWLNPVPGGTYKCHSIHCNLPNSDTSSIRTLSMTQVKGLIKAASGTLDPREGYTRLGYKDGHQHYTALWAKKGEGEQWQWLLHGRNLWLTLGLGLPFFSSRPRKCPRTREVPYSSALLRRVWRALRNSWNYPNIGLVF